MRLTIFTAPKPFINPHLNIIQRNALQSWKHLATDIDVVIVGNEAGMADVAAEFGIRHLPDVTCNKHGTPLVSSIFKLARQVSDASILAYVNADIVLLPDFIQTAQQVSEEAEKYLAIGRRWDMEITELLDFSEGWDEQLRERITANGKLHAPAGSDFFIFPSTCFTQIPDFAVGRSMWDNWMIYHALKSKWVTVDVTGSLTAIHQNHDYSHLPKGQAHYRLPETQNNIRLAGGKRRTMFIGDATFILKNGKLTTPPASIKRFLRTIETFPVLKMEAYFLAQVLFVLYHPSKAYRKTRRWILRQIRSLVRG